MNTVMDEVVANYKPLTSETRVEDFVVPTHLTLGNTLVELPESIKRKDAHFLINAEGKPVRAAWISKPLAHILNSKRFIDIKTRLSQLNIAIDATDDYIAKLIRYGVLRDKHGPGAMAFCQANENVPRESILISARTYEALIAKNFRWRYAKTVMAVRFPNLGPGTTQELSLVVNKERERLVKDKPLSETALGNRIPGLKDLLAAFESEQDDSGGDTGGSDENNNSILDAFYLHPDTLKECFEGDGDGRHTCR